MIMTERVDGGLALQGGQGGGPVGGSGWWRSSKKKNGVGQKNSMGEVACRAVRNHKNKKKFMVCSQSWNEKSGISCKHRSPANDKSAL